MFLRGVHVFHFTVVHLVPAKKLPAGKEERLSRIRLLERIGPFMSLQ